MHYCYIIRRREFVQLNDTIYKIGRTTEQGLKRLLQYDNGMGFEIYGMRKVNNAYKVEKDLIRVFKNKYENMEDIIGSSESFRGNIIDMLQDYHSVCDNYQSKLTYNEILDMYEECGLETLDDILQYTMIKRYLGKEETKFTFGETIEVLDNLNEISDINDIDYGILLGDDSNLEFTRNHALRALYMYNKLSSSADM